MPEYQVKTTSGVVFDVTADDMDEAFDEAWKLLEDDESDEHIDSIDHVKLVKSREG